MSASPQPTLCPACGAANGCAVAMGGAPESCWCQRVTSRVPMPETTAAFCYCPSCFARLAQPIVEPRHDR